MSGLYDDMIDLPHHVSERHPHMPMIDRAAQFSPFAALTGYDAAVKETARITDARIELDESEKVVLDLKLREIADNLEKCPEVRFTYFLPDERKCGGAYIDAAYKVKRVDNANGTICMMDGSKIRIEDVVAIQMERTLLQK